MQSRAESLRLVVLAGEASGDAMGAALLQALRPEEVIGIAGPRMRAEGIRPLLQTESLSMLGLAEPLYSLGRLMRSIRSLREQILAYQPDVVVSIDSPSFNLRVVGPLPFPKLHWVSPQIWAWRRGRASRIARRVDALATLFPFEPGLYAGTGLDVRFTGHPLAKLPWSPQGQNVGLVAGSRPAERRRLGPVFIEALRGMEVIEAVPPGCQPVHPTATLVEGVGGLGGRVDRALVCSGTATLELAVMGIGMVAAYQPDRVTLEVGRRVLRVESVILPNLVLGKKIVPEHIGDLDADRLRADIASLDIEGQR